MASVIGFQGALISGLYALIAVGFTMIYGVGRVENLAHGAYTMIAAYMFWTITSQMGLPIGLGFAGAIGVGIGVSIATYKGLVNRFRDNPVAIFISTLILAVVLQYIVMTIYTPAPRNLLPIVEGVTNIMGNTFSNDLILVSIICWVCLISLLFFVRRTHLGRGIRALAMDRVGAIASGIDPERANLVSWIWAGALAALAGIFFGAYTHLVPHMWVYPLIMAFAIVIVGGLGSIEGSIIAAYIIGMSETGMTIMIAEQLRGVFGMAIMIVILVARPRGLLGKEA